MYKMFHCLPQCGTYNLNAKLLHWSNLISDHCIFSRAKTRNRNFKGKCLFHFLSVYECKLLKNWKNKRNSLYFCRDPFFSTTYQNRTIKTKKEYILNHNNEFEELKTDAPKQRNEETIGEEKTPSIVPEKSKSDIEKNQQSEHIDDSDDTEIKLQKLLKKRKPLKNFLTITEEAVKEIKKIIEEHNKENKNSGKVLKLFFITKGCNGLTHSLQFVPKNKIMKNDEIIYDDDKNILLVVDSKCVLFVINTTLDFYRDELTERFVFINPNITSMCPCGTSFHFSKGAGNVDD